MAYGETVPSRMLGGANNRVVATKGEYSSDMFREITKLNKYGAIAGSTSTRIPAAKTSVDRI